MSIINGFCYLITGIVILDLFVTFLISVAERFSDNFEGVERTHAFMKHIDNIYYIIPTICFHCGDDYLEITVSFLRYCLYITYSKKYSEDYTEEENDIPNDDNQ